ncbi:MAG: acyloxyacyl hydrolase [Phycisphaeraceae bacterium]|nr:acyloxyacyl hydrolase [Phycisphaeraceae bacterium]
MSSFAGCSVWMVLLLVMISTGALADDFAEGAWTLQAYGSGTYGDSSHGDIYSAHLGVGYYFVDDWSLNLELVGGRVVPGEISGDDNGMAAGLDMLFRWHFVTGENWSLYTDFGGGIQQADTNFPSDSHFNFRPQAGLGATWKLAGRARLMGGVRWLHISNAYITPGNNGLDAAQCYGGLMMSF